MTIRPCKCGHTPILVHSKLGEIRAMRLTCACGKHGATLTYTKPEDAERTRQAAIDGWNFAG